MKLKKNKGFGAHGGCIVSNNILLGQKLRWCVKNEPCNPFDSGWFFVSEIDTDEYFEDPQSCTIASWDVIAKIEPDIAKIYDYPVGTDVEMVKKDGEVHFYDTVTGDKVL